VVSFVAPIFDRAGHVARRVEQGVFVGFDQADLGVLQMLLDPVGGDEGFGMRVTALVNGGRGSHGSLY
jgi:hypothetical protein